MALWRQVVLAALLLGFAAFTTSLRGMFLIVSKVE
jgi:hypothetical protein